MIATLVQLSVFDATAWRGVERWVTIQSPGQFRKVIRSKNLVQNY